MPSGIGIIDTMMDLPFDDVRSIYEFLAPNLKDTASKEEFEFPAQYMFKKVPGAMEAGQDPVAHTLALMDHHGIEMAMIGAGGTNQLRALNDHPDRFLPSIGVDPNEGMKAVEAEKFDLILQDPVVFASQRIDITEKVIKALADK